MQHRNVAPLIFRNNVSLELAPVERVNGCRGFIGPEIGRAHV